MIDEEIVGQVYNWKHNNTFTCQNRITGQSRFFPRYKTRYLIEEISFPN